MAIASPTTSVLIKQIGDNINLNIWYDVPYVLTFIAYFENKTWNTIEPKLLKC